MAMCVIEFLARANDNFGGGRRRGRAEVGDEIGDGEVDLMAHAADHRNLTCGDGAGDNFFVEGPEVFERASAARHESRTSANFARLKCASAAAISLAAPSPCTFTG